jgi:hypothetical protein
MFATCLPLLPLCAFVFGLVVLLCGPLRLLLPCVLFYFLTLFIVFYTFLCYGILGFYVIIVAVLYGGFQVFVAVQLAVKGGIFA